MVVGELPELVWVVFTCGFCCVLRNQLIVIGWYHNRCKLNVCQRACIKACAIVQAIATVRESGRS